MIEKPSKFKILTLRVTLFMLKTAQIALPLLMFAGVVTIGILIILALYKYIVQ